MCEPSWMTAPPTPRALTRDYLLELDIQSPDAPLLSVFGGKITTYRKLAERAVDKLAPFFPDSAPHWTATAPLPGGDFPTEGSDAYLEDLRARYTAYPTSCSRAGAQTRHGTPTVLGPACSVQDLGEHFGATALCARGRLFLRT